MTDSQAPGSPDSGPDAPIVAVTVFPDRARVTRRQQVAVPVGQRRIAFTALPDGLDQDSVRVTGVGPATVLGVDVGWEFPARGGDDALVELRRQVLDARAALATLDDEDAVAAGQLEFYAGVARRATRDVASALAVGSTNPARVAQLTDDLATAQAALLEKRRTLTVRREQAREELDARQRAWDARQSEPSVRQRTVVVDLDVTDPASPQEPGSTVAVTLELSYVVFGAHWHSAYDVRLAGDADGHRLTLSWFGLVTQQTGEDWPECDLRLSTARPSGTATVPELDPWFLDRQRPAPPIQPLAAQSFGAAAPMMARAGKMPEAPGSLGFADASASVEQGATAATYRPARAVAVPSDGTAHRATIAELVLAATLDYVTAPVLAAEAQLRATVVNSSEHTLPAGRAAVFHATEGATLIGSAEFIGSTHLDVWAPGEEVELALGVDDRVRVERELLRRGATKAILGAARRRDAEHRIAVTNHTPVRAKVTVLDQLPVSRDEGIVVREQRVEPAPVERTDLGVLTWLLELGPGETKDIHVGVRVESAKGVDVIGWRE